MKNPYKHMSDVNPQTERGSRRIASDVWNALGLAGLGAIEYQIMIAVINLTWGYKKKEARISFKNLQFFTNRSRSAIIENVQRLVRRRILVREVQLVRHGRPFSTYMINKYYDTWIHLNSTPLYTDQQLQLVRKYGGKWYESTRTNGTAPRTPISFNNNNKYKEPEKKQIAPTEIDQKGLALLSDLGIKPPVEDLRKSHKRKSAETGNNGSDPDLEF